MGKLYDAFYKLAKQKIEESNRIKKEYEEKYGRKKDCSTCEHNNSIRNEKYGCYALCEYSGKDVTLGSICCEFYEDEEKK